MAKTAKHGDRKETALVVLGWLAFVVGNLVQVPWQALILKGAARVLP